MQKTVDNELFRTPFSREYWRMAAAEFKNTRMMVFAALMIALRVVFKAIRIPIGPYLDINTAFVINALGAMSFGPVVAIAAAAITDTLGCLLFPSGPYFFPFIFVEIAGSLVFALFLYRAEITAKRIILARFCIDFFVNIVIQTPIMSLYYQVVLGKFYALVDLPRIVKNLVMFPFEAAVLIVLLGYAVPPLNREGVVHSRVNHLKLTRGTIAILAVLMIISMGAVAGYSVYTYNHSSLSASYSAEQRLERNMTIGDAVMSRRPDLKDELIVTVIEEATSQVLSEEVTYRAALYRVDPDLLAKRLAEGQGGMRVLWGYSKSPASKDEALTLLTRATVVLDKKTDALIRYEEDPPAQ